MQLPLGLSQSQQATKWKSILDPVIGNKLLQGLLLTNIPLIQGDNVVNHGLQRKLVGWIVVGINGVSAIYDKQAENQVPDLTLLLNSSAEVTINLWVF